MEEFEKERQDAVEKIDPIFLDRYSTAYFLYVIVRLLDIHMPLPDFYSYRVALFDDLFIVTNSPTHDFYYLSKLVPCIKPVSYLLEDPVIHRASLLDFLNADIKYIVGEIKTFKGGKEDEISPIDFQIRIKKTEYDEEGRIVQRGSLLSYHFKEARPRQSPAFLLEVSTERAYVTHIWIDIISDKMKFVAQKLQEYAPESRIGDLPIRLAKLLKPKRFPTF